MIDNSGSVLEDDLLGVEAGNFSTPYRQYDATLGRFLGVDPLADQYADQGPSTFAGDDPVNQQDPTGAWLEGADGFGNRSLTGGRGHDSFGFSYSSPHLDPSGGGDGSGGFGMGVGPVPTVFDVNPGIANPWATHADYSGTTSAQLMEAARQGGVYANGRIYTLYRGALKAGDENDAREFDQYSYLSSTPVTFHISSNIPGYADDVYLANESHNPIFFKPDNSGEWQGHHYSSSAAYKLAAGSSTTVPIDGISVPARQQFQVLKVVTGTRLKLSESGVDVYIPSIPRLAGQLAIGGWKGESWINYLNSSYDGKYDYYSDGPVAIPGKTTDNGWNELWKTSLPK